MRDYPCVEFPDALTVNSDNPDTIYIRVSDPLYDEGGQEVDICIRSPVGAASIVTLTHSDVIRLRDFLIQHLTE